MNGTKTLHTWEAFLNFFSKQYAGRKTRLGIFETDSDVVNDYWIEDGLQLFGIAVETDHEIPAIDLILDGYSHRVKDVSGVKITLSHDGIDDGVDIIAKDGKTTLLRFENS